MSSQFSLLMKLQVGELHAAAKSWRGLSQHLEEALSQHRSKVNGPLRHANWTGVEADAAFGSFGRSEQQFDVARVEAEAIAMVLDSVADRMYQAQTNLTNAVLFAEANGMHVSGDGQVIAALDSADRHDPDTRAVAAAQQRAAQDRLNAAVAAAQEASDQGRDALRQLNANVLTQPRVYGAAAGAAQDAKAASKALGLADPYIPENKDPKQNADWWKSLTPERQQDYLTLHPGQIGMLDGLPSTIRDQANRLNLDEQLDAMNAGNAKWSGLTAEEYNARENALRGLRDKLDQADGEDDSRQLFLLGLDPSKGQGRAIVAKGNPDMADHTAVLVPGTSTTMASMPGQIDRIAALQDAALQSADGGQSVSVISWLGYDAPQIPPENLSVAGTGRAEAGAADMRRFTEGVRVAERDRHGHLTLWVDRRGRRCPGRRRPGS